MLGTLVNYLSMRPVNTRGLKQANKGMLMAAIAYNVKKLLNYKAPKVMADVKTLKAKAEKRIENLVLNVQALIGSSGTKKQPPFSHLYATHNQ